MVFCSFMSIFMKMIWQRSWNDRFLRVASESYIVFCEWLKLFWNARCMLLAWQVWWLSGVVVRESSSIVSPTYECYRGFWLARWHIQQWRRLLQWPSVSLLTLPLARILPITSWLYWLGLQNSQRFVMTSPLVCVYNTLHNLEDIWRLLSGFVWVTSVTSIGS